MNWPIPYRFFHLPADSEATFLERPNRFLARIHLSDSATADASELAHVHDPGRLSELLFPGNRILVRAVRRSVRRKTRWDIVAAYRRERWVMVHAGYHSGIAERILRDPGISPFGSITDLRREISVGSSRLDFSVQTHSFEEIVIEIKGCSLLSDSIALFPDAPTARGSRHLAELISLRREGIRAGVIFLIMNPDARRFAPNVTTDPRFARIFAEAVESGVEMHPIVLEYDGEFVSYCGPIPFSVE